jgi:molecular chaperone GrpE
VFIEHLQELLLQRTLHRKEILVNMLVSTNLFRNVSNKSRHLTNLGTSSRAFLSSHSSYDFLHIKYNTYLHNIDIHNRINQFTVRQFSDNGQQATGAKQGDSTTEQAQAPSKTDELEAQVKDLNAQLKDLRDQLLRSLAEQDNTRRIARRDVDAAKTFAISSFAKSLLDTSDNLSRAMEAVPPEYRTDVLNHPVLATLYEGIRMTDENLSKAFEKNGLKKFCKVGEKFDPNLHSALFEYPDASKAAGTIGQVMKIGFTLNDRVIRPAEVGVIRNP